jgi:hypothetical protein
MRYIAVMQFCTTYMKLTLAGLGLFVCTAEFENRWMDSHEICYWGIYREVLNHFSFHLIRTCLTSTVWEGLHTFLRVSR